MGRRALMIGAGCAALGLLGACASGSATTPEQSTAAPLPNEAAGGALAKTADVPVGGGGVSADGVLVMQLKAGEFTAYSATCPHQNFRLQPPDSTGTITCLGHMSRFKAADGSVIDGPALTGLTKVAVKVSGTDVVRA